MSHDSAHSDSHGHDDHGHGHSPFLAHHFDDPEQQYDSGKLGMWLFLVTEILFFSGMFCAYALYRSRNPEVFTFASQFLNSTLGAFNTGVLLFSSLTMAWGVRCAQLRQRKGLVICLAITLCCASIFLGVKAVEYTHKWDIGLLPAGFYLSQYAAPEHHAHWSPWLTKLCIVPGLFLIGFAGMLAANFMKGDQRKIEVSLSLVLTAASFFGGVAIGKAFENAEAKAHAAATHEVDGHVDHGAHESQSEESAGHGTAEPAVDSHAEPHSSEGSEGHASSQVAAGHLVSAEAKPETEPGQIPIEMIDQKGGAGLFFSIYYCMTGVHAIHILAGMGVLTWLLVRASKDHFNEEYFGPVDYVGLYWHIVDLIWIYLFPLLYLIK